MAGLGAALREDLHDYLHDLDPVERWAQSTREALGSGDAVQRDPALLARMLPLMGLWSRYFAAELRGLESVPAEKPMLLVGNHSGGILTPDTAAVIGAWYETFGVDRPLACLGFDAIFGVPGFADFIRRFGCLPANMDNASRALANGSSVLVYPGGDHEIFRPYRERNRIDFAGRKGFVRLALRSGVPLVPVVAQGSHECIVVLTRGEKLAQRLGFERLRLGAAPIVWQLPWGISAGGLPYVPLPVKILVEFVAPLDWSHLGPEAADDPAIVDRCYAEVTELMQQRLDALARENPRPLLNRIRALMPGAKHSPASRGRGENAMKEREHLADRVADVVSKGTDAAEKIHLEVANLPLDVMERVELMADAVKEVRRVQTKTIGAVYDLVRGINREVNKLAHELLDTPAEPKAPTRPRAAA